jgi:hypothetical protein
MAVRQESGIHVRYHDYTTVLVVTWVRMSIRIRLANTISAYSTHTVTYLASEHLESSHQDQICQSYTEKKCNTDFIESLGKGRFLI